MDYYYNIECSVSLNQTNIVQANNQYSEEPVTKQFEASDKHDISTVIENKPIKKRSNVKSKISEEKLLEQKLARRLKAKQSREKQNQKKIELHCMHDNEANVNRLLKEVKETLKKDIEVCTLQIITNTKIDDIQHLMQSFQDSGLSHAAKTIDKLVTSGVIASQTTPRAQFVSSVQSPASSIGYFSSSSNASTPQTSFTNDDFSEYSVSPAQIVASFQVASPQYAASVSASPMQSVASFQVASPQYAASVTASPMQSVASFQVASPQYAASVSASPQLYSVESSNYQMDTEIDDCADNLFEDLFETGAKASIASDLKAHVMTTIPVNGKAKNDSTDLMFDEDIDWETTVLNDLIVPENIDDLLACSF